MEVIRALRWDGAAGTNRQRCVLVEKKEEMMASTDMPVPCRVAKATLESTLGRVTRYLFVALLLVDLVLMCPDTVFATTAPLLERHAYDVVIASNSLAYLCSVSHDANDVGTVSLSTIDLTTGTIGTPEVVYTAPGIVTAYFTTDECSLALSGDGQSLIVAYPVYYPGYIDKLELQTSVKDLGNGTWQSTVHPNTIASFGYLQPPSIKLLQHNGSYHLIGQQSLVGNVDGSLLNDQWFASLPGLEADTETTDALTDTIDDRLVGSLNAVFDSGLGAVRYAMMEGDVTAPRSEDFGSVDDSGQATIDAKNTDYLIQSGNSGHGVRAAQVFPWQYHDATSGNTYFVALKPPFSVAGYRLVMRPVGGDAYANDLPLANQSSGYYQLGGQDTLDNAASPEIYGFPFTMDALLSSDAQWVFASRDFQTSRLALHRIPAAFAVATGPEQLQPGTQLPGPLFCGKAMSTPYNGNLYDFAFKTQNDFVKIRELPNDQDLLVVYLTCPDGNTADATPVAQIVSLAFPKLIDDNYSTPRGQALTVGAPGVLANDTDLDAPQLGVFAQPADGTVSLQQDGSFLYTPTPSFCGTDQFTYSVTQGGHTYLARANVQVQCNADIWWTFDQFDPSGAPYALAQNDRIEDVGGHSRDAYVYSSGPQVIPGALLTGSQDALEFAGPGEYLVFTPGYTGFNDTGPAAGTELNFGATDSFTLEAVIRMPVASTTYQAIVGKVTASGVASSWFMQVSDTGLLQGKVADASAASVATGATRVDDGAWHRVAFVRDASAHELRLYVDGVLDANTPDTTTGSLTTASDIAVGAFADNGQRQFKGDIDEVRIVGQALAPDQFIYETDHYPLAADDSAVDADGLPLTVDVTANDDFGLDGPGSIPIQVVSAKYATATVDDNGTPTDPTDDSLVVTPQPGYTGNATVTYSISDLNGDVSDATLTVDVQTSDRIFSDGFEAQASAAPVQ